MKSCVREGHKVSEKNIALSPHRVLADTAFHVQLFETQFSFELSRNVHSDHKSYRTFDIDE